MKAWSAIKIGIFIGMTAVMLFHWQVEEAKAEPLAIVATSSTAAPAENIFYAERIPSGHWENAGRHRITHYDSGVCCNGRNAGRTASGAPMVIGRTVATGRQYPFGTRLLINGTIYTVEDRGVPNGCIDILVGSHAEANRRGLFHTNVFIWREDN